MAHFAKIGLNSKVLAVHVVADKDCLNGDGIEDEEVGRQFLERIHHYPFWIQTSYNTKGGIHRSGDNSKALRGNYAGIGMTYDEDNNIFIHKQPYASWVLNTTTARWNAPITNPTVEVYEEGTWTQEEIDGGGAPDGTSAGDVKQNPWDMVWDESAYQADNTQGWKATKAPDSDPKTVYSWNGTAWVSE